MIKFTYHCFACQQRSVIKSKDNYVCQDCGVSMSIDLYTAFQEQKERCTSYLNNDTKRFTLEGTTYYKEYRRCYNNRCLKCKQITYQGHGPYWYYRKPNQRKSQYIGKQLFSHVIAAANRLTQNQTKLRVKRVELLTQAAALKRLLDGKQLQPNDPNIINNLGFSDCLVSEPTMAVAQDSLTEGD